MSDGHDGAHGAHGATDGMFGAPGAHDTGGLVGHAEHGMHGHGHDHGGHHGGRSGHTFDGISAYFCHHDHHGSKFSFPGPNDMSVGHAAQNSVDAVDPFSATVTLAEALASSGKPEPTRAFQVHVVNHGWIDQAKLMSDLGDQIGKRLFGNRVKLIRVDQGIPAMDKIDDRKEELLSWNARVEKPNPSNMPDGWLEGFTGSTRMLRQYWQLGRWDSVDKRYRFDQEAKTYLECYWLIWRYQQTGSYETKLMVKVHSILRFDGATQSYGFITDQFEQHQLITTQLCSAYNQALKDAKPSVLEQKLLNYHSAEARRKHKHGEGWFPAPRQDEKEMDDADQMDSNMNDKDPRHNPDTSGGLPDAPPADGGSAPPHIPPPPAPLPIPGSVQIDDSAEDGGDFDSGMGTHPPIVPMGIASGADLENVLPGMSVQADKKPDLSGLKKPSAGVWVPPAAAKTVVVKVKLPE